MELLLNLVWLMLAVPGIWFWRRAPARNAGRGLCALRSLLLLGCGLVLLFPVVSATDDLHAMRQEMEESSLSRRTAMVAGEKSQSGLNPITGSLAQTVSAAWLAPALLVCGKVFADSAQPHEQVRRSIDSGRAPPSAHP